MVRFGFVILASLCLARRLCSVDQRAGSVGPVYWVQFTGPTGLSPAKG